MGNQNEKIVPKSNQNLANVYHEIGRLSGNQVVLIEATNQNLADIRRLNADTRKLTGIMALFGIGAICYGIASYVQEKRIKTLEDRIASLQLDIATNDVEIKHLKKKLADKEAK